MDCSDARLLLHFARPLATELEESEAEALAYHLNHCTACTALDRVERNVDHHLGTAMRAVSVPPALRGRLIARLAKERDSWYRHRLLRYGSAVAAAILVAFLGIHYYGKQPPADVNLTAFHDQLNNVQLASADEVEKWFRDHPRVTMKAPAEFNYALLAEHRMADFQGQRVPYLLFQTPNGCESCRVYVLDDRKFNIRSLENQSVSGGRFAVEWRKEPADGHVAYVIVYTGGTLQPFLRVPVAT